MPDMPQPPMPSRMEATALVYPPEKSRAGVIAGLVAAVTVAAAAAFFFYPRKGEVVVSATDAKGADLSHLEVYVDGKKTDCGTSPCTVEEVSAGTHTVKVVADGFPPVAEQAINVSSRQQARAAFAMPATASGTGAEVAAIGGTGVRVGGSQAGVKLYIDDREIGSLPAETHDLTAGSHRVRIAGGDRYAAVEKNVTIAKDEFQDLGSVTLKVVKGKATITQGTPAGAKVYIVSGADRRELPTLPISVDIDTSKQWSLVASKPGFADYNQPISFEDGQAEKTFVVNLDARQAVSQSAAYAPPPPSQPYSPPAPHHSSSSTSSSSGSSGGGDEGAPSGGEGFLNINSIPASSIVLDGKPIGNTPKLRYSVSPGPHTVLFVNTEQSFKKSVTVNVGAGETKAAIGKAD
jgi:serine/threonine-protein kinase